MTHPKSIEIEEGAATLFFPVDIKGNKAVDRSIQYARYKLPPFTYRLLTDFYLCGEFPSSSSDLYHQMQAYLNCAPYYQNNVPYTELLLRVQCYWQLQLPLFFLQDIGDPMSSFSLPQDRYHRLNQKNIRRLSKVEIERIDVFGLSQINDELEFKGNRHILPRHAEQHVPPSLSLISRSHVHWAHKQLIRRYKKEGRNKTVAFIEKSPSIKWSPENILPSLLYLYVAELVTEGGVQSRRLAASSIDTYLSFQEHIEKHPLSYAAAVDDDLLNQWAHTVYTQECAESLQLKIWYFLRFVAEQTLTDSLDLESFSAPQVIQHVDANLVTSAELELILDLLSRSKTSSYLRTLFTQCMAILTFHGFLRRGEILRLRVEDIRLVTERGQRFQLTITKTREGNTKNRKTRSVHLVLPESQAKFIQLLIKIKASAPPDEPLIGFCGESLSSRRLHYVHAVTKAVKAICGSDARFHHLRHGGVWILVQQGLGLFMPHTIDPQCIYLSELLSENIINQRFAHWLEGRDIKALNSSLLLDEVTDMIGHAHFATTRMSYLHGHEWLPEHFNFTTERQYSKPLLRYILGLKRQSNDISRRIRLLQTEQQKASNVSHPHAPVLLSERRVEEGTHVSSNSFSWIKERLLHDNDLYEGWQKRTSTSLSTSLDRLTRHWLKTLSSSEPASQLTSEVTWESISDSWRLLGRHCSNKGLSVPDKKLVKKWLSLFDEDKQLFVVKCTRVMAKEYRHLFSLPEFSFVQRELILCVNRKTHAANLCALIHDEFLLGKERTYQEKHSVGPSLLTIKVEGIPIAIKIYMSQLL